MTTAIFATPDFGAGACAMMVLMLIAVAVATVIILSVWRLFRTVKSAKWRRVVAVCLAVIAILTCFWLWFYDFKPYQDFDRLLAGGKDVRIEQIVFAGQGRQVVLKEPAATAYLTERVRCAVRDEHANGITYYAQIYLSSGGSVSSAVDIPEAKGYVTLYYPCGTLTEGGSRYLVALPDPAPDSLSDAIANLRK
jgi:4-amino-4-deoxy-L-arabinose transferase-like glycosyltransferase